MIIIMDHAWRPPNNSPLPSYPILPTREYSNQQEVECFQLYVVLGKRFVVRGGGVDDRSRLADMEIEC